MRDRGGRRPARRGRAAPPFDADADAAPPRHGGRRRLLSPPPTASVAEPEPFVVAGWLPGRPGREDAIFP
ncbi:MAG: hypothetical protein R3F43_09190 [bacterium]